MFASAVIGGFILAMIEGTGILINRYSQQLMPQPGLEGRILSKKTAKNQNCFVFFVFRTSTRS